MISRRFQGLTYSDRYIAKCKSCEWFRTRSDPERLRLLSIRHYEVSGHFWIVLKQM